MHNRGRLMFIKDTDSLSMFYRILFLLIVTSILMGNSPQKKSIIKLGTLAPSGTEWHGLLMKMGQQWELETGGEVKLRIYPNGVLGDERDMIRKIRIGQIHAAAITAEGITEITPDAAVFFLPKFYDSWEEVNFIRNQIADYLNQKINKSGFKVLFWADVGWVHWFSKEPIINVSDLRGKKIFSWAGDYKTDQIWTQAGFYVVPLAMSDVLSGLQTGLIDAIALNPIFALSTQIFGIANNMLDMKWGMLTGALVIDLQTWEGIDVKNQIIMQKIANEISESYRQLNHKISDDSIKAMMDFGLKVHKPDSLTLAEWDYYLQDIYPAMRGFYVPEDIFDMVIELKTRNMLKQ